MSDGITNEETARLLDSPILARIEAKIADTLHLKITPAALGTTSVELYLAGMSEKRALSLLAAHEHSLIKFGISFYQSMSGEPFGGDYAPGEDDQQDGDDSNTVILGLSHGFGLTYLCYFAFLADGNYDGLDRYLKARRSSGAKKFVAKLKRIYARLQDT